MPARGRLTPLAPNLVRLSLVTLVLVAAGFPVAAAARKRACLAGKDADVTRDRGTVAAAQAALSTACPCPQFDGSAGRTHRSYRACVMQILRRRVKAGVLDTKCAATVRRFYTRTTCGFPAGRARAVCVEHDRAKRRVGCTLKPSVRGHDGTTTARGCASRSGVDRAVCPQFNSCLDATDTNDDLRIDGLDTGECRSSPSIIPASTRVLDPNTLDRLRPIADDGRLVFDGASEVLDGLHVGDVIAGQASDAAPDGLLRRILAVQVDGGTVIVDTAPAALEEAVESGGVSAHWKLQETPSAKILGAGLGRPAATEPGISFAGSGALGPAGVNYNVHFAPSLDVQLDIHDFTLTHALFKASLTETMQVGFTINLLDASAKVALATFPFQAKVIFIAYVPVVVQPIIELAAGIEGHASPIGVQSSKTSTYTTGIEFINGVWNPIAEEHSDYTPTDLSPTGPAQVKATLGPEFIVLVYGEIGPYAQIRTFLEANADPYQSPLWQLFGGIEAAVGLRVNRLSARVKDKEFPGVISYRKLLAQASTTTTTPASSTSTTTDTGGTTTTTLRPVVGIEIDDATCTTDSCPEGLKPNPTCWRIDVQGVAGWPTDVEGLAVSGYSNPSQGNLGLASNRISYCGQWTGVSTHFGFAYCGKVPGDPTVTGWTTSNWVVPSVTVEGAQANLLQFANGTYYILSQSNVALTCPGAYHRPPPP